MKVKNKLVRSANNAVSPERDGKTLRRCAGILLCSLILMVGFFAAARQHFAALDWSQKNVKLRQQREQLKNDRQRLLLERETALSSQVLAKKAEKIGLQMIRVSQINSLAAIFSDKPATEKSEAK